MATSSSSARLLAGLLLASLLPAQGVPELEFDRVQITWPNQPNGPYSFSGLDRTMACGAFLDGFDGRSVVVIRGTNLYMSFQPVLFEHLVGVPTPVAPNGNEQIATLEAFDGGGDRLAVLRDGLFQVWSYDQDNGAFVDAVPAIAAPTGVIGLRPHPPILSGPYPPANPVLLLGATWVASVNVEATQTTTSAVLPLPNGVTLCDAAYVDWVPGGRPEIAALTTAGLFVLDETGAVLEGDVTPVVEGKVCVPRFSVEPTVIAAVPAGADWRFRTWIAGSSTPVDSAVFSLPSRPTGLRVVDLDGDNYEEVIVSSSDSRRRVFVGTASGPDAVNDRYDILDLPLNELPQMPADNILALAIDDIDRDGHVDFIIESAASNSILVLREARPQFFSAANRGLPPPPPAPAIQSVEAVVLVTGTSGTGWMFSSASITGGALGLRFGLPGIDLTGYHLEVMLFPGDVATGGGGFSAEASARYSWPLGLWTPTSTSLDVLVPFTDPLFQAMQPDDKYKFGVEAYLVGPNGSTLPVLSEQHVYCYVGDYVDLEPFNPDWEVAWALDADDLDFPTWRDLALGTYVEEVYNDPQNPPGQLMNRYIGLHIAVRKLPKSLATPPSAPDSPTQLNNGQVR